MRISSFSLVALFLSSACDGSFLARVQGNNGNEDTSKASFNVNYLIFTEGPNGATFRDEEALLNGDLRLRFLLGNDPDRNGHLDDADVVVSVLGDGQYPQQDAEDDGNFTFDYGFTDDDGDGLIEIPIEIDAPGILTDDAHYIDPAGFEDVALANGSIPLGEYDLFAIEVLDGNEQPILWKDSLSGAPAARISYDPCVASAGVGSASCPGADTFLIDVVTTFGFGVSRSYTNLDGSETMASEIIIYVPESDLE